MPPSGCIKTMLAQLMRKKLSRKFVPKKLSPGSFSRGFFLAPTRSKRNRFTEELPWRDKDKIEECGIEDRPNYCMRNVQHPCFFNVGRKIGLLNYYVFNF